MTEPANAQVWVSSGFKPGADAQHETAYCKTSALNPLTGAVSVTASDYEVFIASCSIITSVGDTINNNNCLFTVDSGWIAYVPSAVGTNGINSYNGNPNGTCTINFLKQQGVDYTINSYHAMTMIDPWCDPEGFYTYPPPTSPATYTTDADSITKELVGTGASQCYSEYTSNGGILLATTSAQYFDCSAPTITSVTPDGWWASQSADITINGGCFLTSSDANGPSKVTVTDGKNAVTLSNINVVSSKQITATVNITKKAPSSGAAG